MGFAKKEILPLHFSVSILNVYFFPFYMLRHAPFKSILALCVPFINLPVKKGVSSEVNAPILKKSL